jgi:hypothetical protein
MRAAILFTALTCTGAPALAQQTRPPMQETVTGGGQLPAGWRARRDKLAADAQLDNVKFVTMGTGLHATMGMTNATFWNPQNSAKGDFEVSAAFSQSKPNPMHPEGYGLVIGGSNLDKANQSYTYFLAREGRFLINHRAGEEIHKIVPWTEHAAINRADANGRTSNAMSVQVTATEVKYLVNGQVVHTQPRAQAQVDGVAGLRVNMHQDMHIADFKIKPAAK